MHGAVVVVNYGSHALLERNIGDLAARVIVVDNFSTPGEREAVTALCAERDWLLVTAANDGFGAGVNRGVRVAIEVGEREIVLLNPDALAAPEVIAALVEHVHQHPGEVVSPTIRTPTGRVEFAGSLVSLATGRIRRGWQERDDDPQWRNWLSGACMAVSKDVFEAVGGMSEDYFLYWEDVDFSRRVAAAGFRLVVRDDLEVVHDEGSTHGGAGSRAKTSIYYYFNTRNRLLFGSRFAAAALPRWVVTTPRESASIWLRGGRRQLLSDPGGAVAAVKGTFAGLAIAARAGLGRKSMGTSRPADRVPGRLALGVLTFKRPHLLAELLPLLVAQLRDVAELDPVLIVVDNDPERSAAEVVAAAGAGIRYAPEPEPGLSAARNRALSEASDYALLAFIDDDEQPEVGWLRALVDTYAQREAVAVTGPVRSLPATPLDGWLDGSGLFAMAGGTTGDIRPGLATNNLLLDLDWLRARDIRFDRRFGLTGGEDSMLGQTIRGHGGAIVWCAEAVVSEIVPVSRLSRAWVLDRAARFGESWVRVRVIDRRGARATLRRLRFAAKGAARIVRGNLTALWWRLRRDDTARARAEVDAAGGRGMIRGAVGVNTEEYGRR